jgi:hypothetical protein
MELSKIEGLIYHLRGQRVMLDRDLAALYGVETGALNRAVKRNLRRFPPDFMFQISVEERDGLKCQIGISRWGGDRALPHAFTEHGVAMLSSVLNSPRAIAANIEIMRAFTRLRGLLAEQRALMAKLSDLEKRYDAKFRDVFAAIRQVMEPPAPARKKIGFAAGS